MKLPIHPSYTRCLAHPHGHTGKGSPKVWCVNLATCARHQTVSFDDPNGFITVRQRLCDDHDDNAYINMATPPEVTP